MLLELHGVAGRENCAEGSGGERVRVFRGGAAGRN